jgi:secreted trypsin-like serine protease
MPWLIYIQISFISIFSNALQTYPCTGSLVSHRHVLTSAHCIPLPRNRLNGTGMNITVFYGAANHSEGHPIPIDWETNFQVHPNFTLGLRTNNTFGNGTDSYVINDLAIIDVRKGFLVFFCVIKHYFIFLKKIQMNFSQVRY